MNEPVRIFKRRHLRLVGSKASIQEMTIDFEGLTFGRLAEIAREQWDLRNEIQGATDEEFNEDTVIDELREGVFWI